ncbi:MAG: long-chain fatty acid--CoA ligase [Alphaproteobacteria bacterium]
MAAFEEVVSEVRAFVGRTGAGDAPVDDDAFEQLALRVFAAQFELDAPFRALCERRGAVPGRVDDWRRIPAVPTAAFRSLDFACAPGGLTFLTSGTTGGAERRGRHPVPRPEVYREGAIAHFRRMVLPDGIRPRLVALLAGPDLLPQSSLVRMVDWIREDLAADAECAWLVGRGPFDPAQAADRIEEEARRGAPICLVGVRVLFTTLLEHCRIAGRTLVLPADSRVVDTGGPKGGRALSDAGFLAAAWHVLGVPAWSCVNEYGMTELCSQFYDDVMVSRFAGSNAKRRKLGPAWTRTRAVDPSTLEAVPDGEPGILCHVDLANVGSVLAVQTEDVGIREPDGRFALRGRLPGAPARGCALALADLLGETA